MNKKKDLKLFFQKYIENTLSKKEFKAFMARVKNSENSDELKTLMEEHWNKLPNNENRSDYAQDDTSEERYRQIATRIRGIEDETKNKVKGLSVLKNRVFKVAAAVVLLLGTTLLLKYGLNGSETVPANSVANPGAVTLKLQDGKVKVIFADKEEKITDAQGNILGSQKGNQISYQGLPNSDKLIYNELTVPYGNRFDLVLSDGTQIKLNAGSWIKYPVRFSGDGLRKVYLKGEAYFDVTEDIDRPFIVNANQIDVEVLGTEFNMSFYPEDAHINTVLVEGSVKIYENGQRAKNAVYLKPDQKASWNKQYKSITVSKVETDLYTAWKDGVLLFRKTPFNSIRKKLERHFDIVIRNDYKFLEKQVYTASFKNEDIHEILEAFRVDTPFEYEYISKNNMIKLTQN